MLILWFRLVLRVSGVPPSMIISTVPEIAATAKELAVLAAVVSAVVTFSYE